MYEEELSNSTGGFTDEESYKFCWGPESHRDGAPLQSRITTPVYVAGVKHHNSEAAPRRGVSRSRTLISGVPNGLPKPSTGPAKPD